MIKSGKNKSVLIKLRKVVCPALAGGLTCFILMAVLWHMGIYPFGDKTLVYHDMEHQYVDFFMWFHNVLHGKDFLTYSFNAGMGNGTIALVAYYLASPLNLLVYFFSVERIAEFLTLLIVLKLVLCSITAFIYLEDRFNIPLLHSIMIAVSYSLMGYNVLQCSNVMWLDGVVILPIIALGIYKGMWCKRHRIYFFALFYGIFSNWYVGYMLCLFAILYFLFEIALYYGEKPFKLKEAVKKIIGFGIVSILSFLATSILFVPQTLYMAREGEGFDWSIFTPAFSFSFLDGFRDLFLEPDKLTFIESNPPIYVGTFVILLIVIFFINKDISLYLKKISAVFLIGFMFIFNFKPTNYIFTAFKIPSSHTYRYAFIYSFFMIVVAAMCIRETRNRYRNIAWKAGLLLAAIVAIFDFVHPFANTAKAYFSAAVAIAMGIILNFEKDKRKLLRVFSHIILIGLLMLEFAEKLQMEFEDHIQSASVYREYNQAITQSLNNIRSKDSEFFRVDKNLARAEGFGNNESLAFGYSSIAQYSSTNNVEVAEFLELLGYTGNTTVIPYRPILATDALLGNKYIYSRVPVFGCEMIQENIFNDIDVYYNPYALKLGYQIADRKAINNFSNNAFENQEILFSNFTGKSVDLYSDSEILSKETDYTSWTEWKIKTKKSGAVYAYFINNLTDALVYVNNECIGWTAWFDKPMLYLGEYDEGETLRLKVYHEGGGYQENYGLCVATLDMKQFENVISIFSTQTCHIKEMKDGYLKAEYDCKKEGTLMLTIPYENGWTLKVNGQDQPLKKVANIFMGVDIEKGKNIIELKYNVPGKALGMILSGIGFLLFFVWEYMVKRIENQRRERKKMLSVILPSYNENSNIVRAYQVIKEILTNADIPFELIYVNDGSRDNTWDEICKTVETGKKELGNNKVKGVSFSRNFGKEAAVMAGLANATGDASVVMDCDLQHPPETLVEMYRLWEQGYELVEGVKRSRGRENILYKAGAKMFYRLMTKATNIDMSRASDFKLMDKKVVKNILSMPERNMFFRGLSSWVGFRKTEVEFDVREREAGESKWSKWSLVKYAVKNIAAFSTVPMQFVTVAGTLTFVGALIVAIQTLVKYFTGTAVQGFTTVILLLLIIGSVIMLSLGIVGYYIAKIYEEVKRRPVYIISEVIQN